MFCQAVPSTPTAPAPTYPLAESNGDALLLALTNALLYAKRPGLVWRHWRRIDRLPNIAQPRSYTERMLWRKLIDHNPQFVAFADKLAAKEFLRARCPDLPVPRTLWSGREFDAIPEELLRGDVLVKANHGCGFNHHIRGGKYDRDELRRKTRRWLKRGYGRKNGEWAYSQVQRKLLVEEAVGDAEGSLLEINVRACNGKAILGSVMGKVNTPAHWAVDLDPAGVPTWGMLDLEGGPITPLPAGIDVAEPYRRAVQFTEALSVGVDYARFDFMWNGVELYGGEITVYPAAGLAEPGNAWTNRVILTGWELAQSHLLQTPQSGWKRSYAAALRRRLAGAGCIPASRQ